MIPVFFGAEFPVFFVKAILSCFYFLFDREKAAQSFVSFIDSNISSIHYF